VADTPYLIDTNVLLCWIKPDRDYPIAVAAIEAALSGGFALRYTSQKCRGILEYLPPPAQSQRIWDRGFDYLD
jgi:hypothetical protein